MSQHNESLIENFYAAQVRVNTDISLASGQMTAKKTVSYEESLNSGLKLVLITKGALRCRIPGQSETSLEGPVLCVIASNGEFTYQHLFEGQESVQYTIVELAESALEPFSQELLPIFQRAEKDPWITAYRAPSSLAAIANQINSCPQHGMVREFYLQAKALEFTALSAELIVQEKNKASSSMGWRNVDLEKLNHAKYLLEKNLYEPLTLDQLAIQAGLNTKKLSTGFREVFKTTVYGYLQEQRLQEAYRLLSTGEHNVSTVAYQVGYTPAHFSVVFRKRFQISPSDLVTK